VEVAQPPPKTVEEGGVTLSNGTLYQLCYKPNRTRSCQKGKSEKTASRERPTMSPVEWDSKNAMAINGTVSAAPSTSKPTHGGGSVTCEESSSQPLLVPLHFGRFAGYLGPLCSLVSFSARWGAQAPLPSPFVSMSSLYR
jgi:hypothetical protein